MQLRELQRELQRDLLGEPSTIGAAIVEAPPLTVDARLGIYRHAYRARLAEALDDIYPILHKILGDETFASMAELFIEAHPSVHRSIRWYGRELADFLAGAARRSPSNRCSRRSRASSGRCPRCSTRPTRRRSIGPRSEASIPGTGLRSRFRFHPSMRRLAFAVEQRSLSGKRMSDDEEPPRPKRRARLYRGSSGGRISRTTSARSMRPRRRRSTPRLAGKPFGEICDALGAFLAEDEIPLRAATLAARWVDGGIIVGIDP